MTDKKVTVFSTPTCSWCVRVKDYLKKNGVSFSDLDVSKDYKAAQDMIRKTGSRVSPRFGWEVQL